jgi:D-galactarolactone cycloisomerase
LGLAADLQLASAIPDAIYVEYIGGSPYVDGIVLDKFALDGDGRLAIPDGPGLGITLDHDAVARYSPSTSEFFAER